MPVFNWQLTGHDSGVSVMAIFEHLQQVVAMCITERSQAKVVQEEDIGFRQDRHEFHITPSAFRNRQLLEKPGEAEREGAPPLPAGFMARPFNIWLSFVHCCLIENKTQLAGGDKDVVGHR